MYRTLLCKYYSSSNNRMKIRLINLIGKEFVLAGRCWRAKNQLDFLLGPFLIQLIIFFLLCLDFLADRLALVEKCCGGKLDWSDLSIPCLKLRVSTIIPSQKLLCVQTEIKKPQKNHSEHHDINKKL
jgi:hypothetical protein